ncbi:MAG: hypothetical protein K8T90_18140 [Planctomycetes bacterium]|nr:hypothetical protein [Planctomycetota bacterium]
MQVRRIAQLVGAALLVAGAIAACRFERARFDPDRWREGALDESESNPREWMAEGVRIRLLAERPTRSEVHALLGEPDFDFGGESPDGSDEWSVGLEQMSIRLDPWALVVTYGPDGRVAEARIGE